MKRVLFCAVMLFMCGIVYADDFTVIKQGDGFQILKSTVEFGNEARTVYKKYDSMQGSGISIYNAVKFVKLEAGEGATIKHVQEYGILEGTTFTVNENIGESVKIIKNIPAHTSGNIFNIRTTEPVETFEASYSYDEFMSLVDEELIYSTWADRV